MTRQEIAEKYEGFYFRGINDLNDIEKPSIDILDPEMVELSGGQEGIEQTLMDNNLETWYYETLEDGSVKLTYEGVNALTSYQAWIHDQYDFLAVLDADCLGGNLMDDGDIVRVNNIIAVFDKNGNQIR